MKYRLDHSEKSPVSIVEFANCEIYDESRKLVKIASLWQKQTILFVFLRHFACLTCRGHAVEVWRDRDKYQSKGAKIAFIGNGSPDFLKKFKEDLNLAEAPVFTDPSLSSFHAAGFKRGFLAAIGPRAILNGRKMMQRGHEQGSYSKESGDLWQLGGLLVIRPSGEIAYHYISEVLGDYAPEEDVIKYGV
jgi:hypothetical protein